jgi:hypothetical protein
MRTPIELENVNLNATNFLKWIAKHPDKESNYLKCQLKDVVIEVEEEDLIALIGNDGREIFLNYFDYEDVSDFISMDELIENNIIKDPLFVVIADYAGAIDDGCVTDTCIKGITDNYTLAQYIARDVNGYIELAKMNKKIEIQAGFYME